MPTTDWNWFFSSVAQSAAAIVGIFGAFIVTKILSSQSAFAEKSRRVQELVTLGEKLRDASGRLPFDWYHRHDTSSELDDLEKLLEKDGSLTAEALYDKLRFSPYIAKDEAIQTIARAKTYREARIKQEREEARRQMEEAKALGLGRAFAAQLSGDLRSSLNSPMQSMLAPQLSKARNEIDAMYAEVRHHARLVTDLVALVASNPESSRLVTASLVLILLLFFAGVVYPLSFMPLPTDWRPAVSLTEVPNVLFSLRGAMLAVVSALFSVMLAMFFVLNLRLRYPRETVATLSQYRELRTYSQYFANREANA